MVAPVNRLCPMTAMLKDVIAGGELGTIYSVMTATHFPADYGGSGFDRSWHYGAAGGPIRDRTIYSLTTLTDLFGAARRVTAMSNLRNPSVRADAARAGAAIDDNSLILLEFADGVQAVASGTFSMEGEMVRACFLGVYGSDGTIETTTLDPLTWFPTEARVRTRDVNGEVSSRTISCPLTEVPALDPPHDKIDECHVYADIAHLADGVLSGRTPLETAAQARHIVDIIDKAYGAAKTGQTQALTTAF